MSQVHVPGANEERERDTAGGLRGRGSAGDQSPRLLGQAPAAQGDRPRRHSRASSSSGTFWTFIQKPVYTAKSQLLIEKEPNILSFDQVLQIESMRDDFYQTQYRLLSGRGLADTVIERLKLYENAEFVGKPEKTEKARRSDRPRLPRGAHRRASWSGSRSGRCG